MIDKKMKTPDEQYFNLMNALADSVLDMSDEEILEEPDEVVENPCAYICGPHLEPCVRAKFHRGDCHCRSINDSEIPCIVARAKEQAHNETNI